MSRDEFLERLDKQMLQLTGLQRDLGQEVQLIPGDETSRKLRHVQDSVGRAGVAVETANRQLREIGDWE